MRNVGKVTVQLLDGTGYGPRLVEIGNWVGKGFFAPRRSLASILDREDCSKPGVYCLKYIDPENGREFVYIGEADCLSARLRTHLRDPRKNHFVEAMFFISHNDWLTKTQVKYLEHRLIAEAAAKNAPISNQNRPSLPAIQGSEKPDLEDFLERIILLLPIMGFRFMVNEFIHITEEFDLPELEADEIDEVLQDFTVPPRKLRSTTSQPNAEGSTPTKNVAEKVSHRNDKSEASSSVDPETNAEPTDKVPLAETPSTETSTDGEIVVGKYRIVDKYLHATMDIVDDYFVVRAGSQARKNTSNSIDKIYLALRSGLIESQILVDDGEHYRFATDYRFTSASAASNVVTGRQTAGPRKWVDHENRSLRGIVNDNTNR